MTNSKKIYGLFAVYTEKPRFTESSLLSNIKANVRIYLLTRMTFLAVLLLLLF